MTRSWPGHLRLYGQDIADRLREAGFDVAEERPTAELSARLRHRYGVPWWERVYVCTRSLSS